VCTNGEIKEELDIEIIVWNVKASKMLIKLFAKLRCKSGRKTLYKK